MTHSVSGSRPTITAATITSPPAHSPSRTRTASAPTRNDAMRRGPPSDSSTRASVRFVVGSAIDRRQAVDAADVLVGPVRVEAVLALAGGPLQQRRAVIDVVHPRHRVA